MKRQIVTRLDIDGQPAVVHGDKPLTPEGREALTELVRAAARIRPCVLCGSQTNPVHDFHTRDFRGQQIIVQVCDDPDACVRTAVAKRRDRVGFVRRGGRGVSP